MALTNQDKEFICLSLAPIIQDISSVKEHLSKMNGKILKHEEQITEALIERAKNREQQSDVKEDVKTLLVKTEKIECEMLEYRFFKKYPKSLLYLTLGFITLVLYEIAGTFLF